jgi:hypothetical protein
MTRIFYVVVINNAVINPSNSEVKPSPEMIKNVIDGVSKNSRETFTLCQVTTTNNQTFSFINESTINAAPFVLASTRSISFNPDDQERVIRIAKASLLKSNPSLNFLISSNISFQLIPNKNNFFVLNGENFTEKSLKERM